MPAINYKTTDHASGTAATVLPLFKRKHVKTRYDMNNTSTPEWVYGMEGLAELLQVSISTAKRIKKRGSLKKAIHQEGRTILTNAPLALELFGATPGKHHTNL